MDIPPVVQLRQTHPQPAVADVAGEVRRLWQSSSLPRRIKPGMSVKVQIDSMPGKQYDGTVGFISPEAEFTPKTVQTEQVRDDLVYRIRVIANDPDNVFRQGMPVIVNIPAAQAQTLAGSR